jgi:hypothetical protein
MSPLEMLFFVRKRGRRGGRGSGGRNGIERKKFNRQVGGIKSYKKTRACNTM